MAADIRPIPPLVAAVAALAGEAVEALKTARWISAQPAPEQQFIKAMILFLEAGREADFLSVCAHTIKILGHTGRVVMADDDWYTPPRPPAPPQQLKSGELLFEFVRERDRKQFRCELRFNGETYGWEVQYLEDGEVLFSHGLFMTRAAAVRWAEQMRPTVEKGGQESQLRE